MKVTWGTCAEHSAQKQAVQQMFDPSYRFSRILQQLLDLVPAANATELVGPESVAPSSPIVAAECKAFILGFQNWLSFCFTSLKL